MRRKMARVRGSFQTIVTSGFRVLQAMLGSQRPSGVVLECLLHEAIRNASRSTSDSAFRSEARTPRSIASASIVPASIAPASIEGMPSGIESMVDLGCYEGVLAEILVTAKYQAWSEPLERLGLRLGEELQATASWLSEPGGGGSRPLVVPVPSPRLRRWHRGLDHTVILAEGVAQVIGGDLRSLFARSWSPPQMSLSRQARRNVGSSLRLRGGASRALRRRRTVLIVDDVTTTGSTLAAMAKALCEGGAGSVHACVVASGRSGCQVAARQEDHPIPRGVRGG